MEKIGFEIIIFCLTKNSFFGGIHSSLFIFLLIIVVPIKLADAVPTIIPNPNYPLIGLEELKR